MSLISNTSNKPTPPPTNQPTFLSLQILSVSTILVLCLILGATLFYVYGEVFIPAQTLNALPPETLLAPTKSVKNGALLEIERSVASSTTAITQVPDIFSASAPAPTPAQSKAAKNGSQRSR